MMDRSWAAVRGLGLAALLASGLLLGCSHPPADSTPEGALREFLDDMDDGDNPASVHKAYDLLGPAARGNLTGRARRTSALQGRQVQPWEMLAAGLFGLTFRPTAMRSAIVGERATVEVVGEDPQSSHATIACVREAGGWRIEPNFPEP
jgi:hypothetical protein